MASENSSHLDIMVKPEMKELVMQLLTCADAPYSVIISDLQKSIDTVSKDLNISHCTVINEN